ncbi:armadillo-type protein [Chaetomium strumarium]|uniref:Armadillo-type protein n=1 Tax=Chaetomium strumarium TaxID=1170767 RepID=A0AAJ0M0F8_9PEZI|nr:armadillo-type protein [Chaetomium strumarium]
MDKLQAKLMEQQALLQKQMEASNPASSSLPITPGVEGFSVSAVPTGRSASAAPNEASEEMLRLKLELAQARDTISRLEAQKRAAGQGSGRASPSPVAESDYKSVMATTSSPAASRFSTSGMGFNAPGKMPHFTREQSWAAQDDTRSEISDAVSTGAFHRSRGIWSHKPAFGAQFPQNHQLTVDGAQPSQWSNTRAHNFEAPVAAHQTGLEVYRQDRFTPDQEMIRPMGRRGHRYDNRYGASSNFSAGFGTYNMGANMGANLYDPAPAYPAGAQGMMGGGIGMGMYTPYPQQTIATTLSPLAAEFTSTRTSWNGETTTADGQTYVSPTTEPLNYRRLLDRNVSCDWKYIVDKIVCNNDQQASIFLQQKLKVGTPEQKYDIVEAIVAQAYPLMVNRFGNFLVQRCFEHGTPEQVIKIAEAIRGNTLNLSMDPFGCHVVQKAFDSVPEDYKAIMVHELLRRIPETVIHRYACHVWQKLFELRWTGPPPQIMKYVNDALRGMWHEVALGETGSLVVQNIFENCLEEDKRPCIEEVLANIDIVAHGQFGNWCIQHICEHGAPPDRSRAVDHVIRYAAKYSMDQFASKVVEKCLKIGGSEFLSRYLERVCEGRVDRPRIPLIDIASDQYGNYLIQYILTHAAPQHRDVVAAHIRKHMVSLRGSKFGSRVGMLCTNHAAATRPGPGAGPMPGRVANARYAAGFR